MNDKDFLRVLIPVLQAGMQAQGATVGIKQSYQPTQQGTPTLPTLFLHNVAEKRYGFPTRSQVFDLVTGIMTVTQSQWTEATYQINALAKQFPSRGADFTANDLVNMAALAVSDENAITMLYANGIGLLRVLAVKQTYFTDESHEYEASPSVDVIFSYQRTMVTQVGSAAAARFGIYGVGGPVTGSPGAVVDLDDFTLDQSELT